MKEFFETIGRIRVDGLISPRFNGSVPGNVAIPLFIACALVGYLLGSINFAVLISKYKYKEDVREFGSGNGGTTNMMRNYGTGDAILTLLGDMLKAFVAVLIGTLLLGLFGGYMAGLFCVVGHCFPVFCKFKGGKGVATTAMVVLCLSPLTFLVLFLIFAILVIGYKYISLASVMCMLMYPVILNMIDGPMFTVHAIFIGLLVIFMHRENIKRLLNRTESKFSFKKHGDRNKKEEENS